MFWSWFKLYVEDICSHRSAESVSNIKPVYVSTLETRMIFDFRFLPVPPPGWVIARVSFKNSIFLFLFMLWSERNIIMNLHRQNQTCTPRWENNIRAAFDSSIMPRFSHLVMMCVKILLSERWVRLCSCVSMDGLMLLRACVIVCVSKLFELYRRLLCSIESCVAPLL